MRVWPLLLVLLAAPALGQEATPTPAPDLRVHPDWTQRLTLDSAGTPAAATPAPTPKGPLIRFESHWYGASAFLGDSQIPLDGTRFYEVVGRPDLARHFRARRHATVLALIAGAAVTGAAVALAQDRDHVDAAVGFNAVGIGFLLSAAFINPDNPANGVGGQILAADYNARMKGEPSPWEGVKDYEGP